MNVSNSFKLQLSALDSLKGIRLSTNTTNQLTIVPSSCSILEMEDVLFHTNSAVVMPENPEGKSSSQGSSDSEQLQVSGVRALALVFRQLQVDPGKRVLICGHTDRSGTASFNFELSALRGQGVYLLLAGKRTGWALLAESRHRIEDYQQIMNYHALVYGWMCDPGAVDNSWGTKTEKAVHEFILAYNVLFPFKDPGAKLDPALIDQIKSGDHKWPKEMWEAVYDLYEHDIVKTTTGADRPDKKFIALRTLLISRYVDTSKPYVACGESFPIDEHPGVAYRSQKDRRVEVLFFDENEVPVLDCPERVMSIHTKEECPLRRNGCFSFNHIDPAMYFTAEYHFKIEYYDRIHEKYLSVPEGLAISAWKETTIGLKSSQTFGNGMYTVTVEGITNSPREDDIHFTFATAERTFLYTKDSGTDPFAVTATQLEKQLAAERDALPADQQAAAPLTFEQLPLIRQRHYYDLPENWDCRNWFCRKGAAEGVWKEIAVQETSTAEPILFSLDDVVLVNQTGGGALAPIKWKPDNRFSALSVRFAVNNPDPDQPYFTMDTAPRNCLNHLVAGDDLRAVAFAGKFHDITTHRTTDGDIIGARAAICDDASVHLWEKRREPVAKWCGHNDIHYFSRCLDADGNECSVLLVYWVAHMKKGAGTVTDADLDNFRKKGFTGSKERWEKKNYRLEPQEDPENRKIKVLPKFFFEENLQVAKPHCILTISDPADPDFRSNMGLDSAEFSKNTFEEDAGMGKATEDGLDLYWYTMAHELGHASGLDDEYLESIEEDTAWTPVLPKFEQYYPGMPYSADPSTMMQANQAPRLRHVWIQCRWVNESASVKALTGNTVFSVRHDGNQVGAVQKFNYYLPPARSDFYTSAYEEANISNGANGKYDLFLYQLGEDETTNGSYVQLVAGQSDFSGILVMRVNILWLFKNYSGNLDDQWTSENEKLNFLRDFQDDINRDLCHRFWLTKTGTDKVLRKNYLFFLPHYQFEGATGSGEHFKVTLRKNEKHTGLAVKESLTGKNLTVGMGTDSIMIFRYMCGLSPKKTDGKSITTISVNDLDFIKKWVKNKVGSDYVIHE